MKQRNVMAVIFYSIFTLGIYDLFWLVSVKKELNAKTSVHTPSMWVLFAPLLALFVPLILLIVVGSSAGSTSHSAANTTLSIVSLLVYLVAFLVFLPITFYWFLKFSKAVSQYTHGELNTAVTFLLLWMLRFVGLAIIQDKFNDMLAADPSDVAPAMATPMADAGVPPTAAVPTVDAPQDPTQPPQSPTA